MRGDVLRATTFAAEPASAGRARRFVAAAVEDLGHRDLLDAAELGVSELVTNALLHGRSPVEVSVLPADPGVRICVRDDNPAPAVPKEYDALAATGRGLTLVADLASAVGVELHGEAGKTMWFELSADRAGHGAADPGAWFLPQRPEGAGYRAVLRDLPLRLWAAAQQHTDGMLREVLLHSLDPTDPADPGSGQAPAEQPAGAARILTLDDLASAEVAQSLLAAAVDEAKDLASGDRVAVTLVATDKDLRALAVLQDVLDAGDQLAAAGRLLAFPALPEVVGLRDWCCQQVVAQANGVAATPWELTDPTSEGWTARFEVSHPLWDDSDVRAVTDALVVADDHNRIIAVSPAACELLGWEEDDLVGRRVVTLVPPRLREAHVAGFTRHQATGQERLMGRHEVMPALHRDGREVACRFLLTRGTSEDGRSIYVALLAPLLD